MIPQNLIDAKIDAIDALVKAKAAVEKSHVGDTYMTLIDTIIVAVEDALKTDLINNAVDEKRGRPTEAPAWMNAKHKAEDLLEALKNPMRRDGIDVVATLEDIMATWRRS